MRFMIEGSSRTPRNEKSAVQHDGRSSGSERDAKCRWLTPDGALACSCCGATLIDLQAVEQAAKRLPPLPFWRADTRRIMVRCTACKHFHEVFAYRVFNWIPPARLTAEMTVLNVLVGILVLCAALPHPPILSLVAS